MVWSLGQVPLHPLLEKVVDVGPLPHLLVPSWASEVLIDLHQILEIVEGKLPQWHIYDEEGQVAHLHIDIGCQSYPPPIGTHRSILHDVELVEELDETGVYSDWEIELFL